MWRAGAQACANVTLGRFLVHPDEGARGGKEASSSMRGGWGVVKGASGSRVSSLGEMGEAGEVSSGIDCAGLVAGGTASGTVVGGLVAALVAAEPLGACIGTAGAGRGLGGGESTLRVSQLTSTLTAVSFWSNRSSNACMRCRIKEKGSVGGGVCSGVGV